MTVPLLVDEDGDKISSEFLKSRRKRSYQPTQLNYKLQIEGEELVVQLSPYNEFISPNLVIERWTKNNRTRRQIAQKFWTGTEKFLYSI